MPWSIWPSLMVLWGVCWMFVVSWSDANYSEGLAAADYLIGEQSPYSPFLFNLDYVPSTAEFDQALESIGADLLANSSLYPHDANHDVYNGFIENPPIQNLLAPVASPGAVGLSADGRLDFGSSSNERNRLDEIASAILEAPIEISRAPLQTSLNQQEGFNTGNHHLAALPAASATRGSSQLPLIGQLSRGSTMAPEQPETPPRRADGNYICFGFGCSNQRTFRTRSEWQTHHYQHTRPFICSVEGCRYRSARKNELARHQESIHSIRRSQSSGSSGLGKGRSSMMEITEPAPAPVPVQYGPASMSTDKSKGKRKLTHYEDEPTRNDLGEQRTGSSMDEKSAKLARWTPTRREQELAQENERLRQELEKVREELLIRQAKRDEEKKEREMLLSIIDRVTKQMK